MSDIKENVTIKKKKTQNRNHLTAEYPAGLPEAITHFH